MASKSVPLIPNWQNQNPYTLKQYNPGTLRKEYTRVRDIARKRILRLEKSGLVTAKTAQQMRSYIPRLRDMKQQSLPTALAGVYRFLQSPRSTVSGARLQRKISIENLNYLGLPEVNEDNADRYFRFLDEASAKEVDGKTIGSSIVLRFLAETSTPIEEIVKLREEFDEWLEKEVEDGL